MEVNMKNFIVIIIFFFATTIFVNAQDKKGSSMYFGAIAGTQINNFNKHFAVNVDPRLYSFSIGAGSAWTKKNYVIGFEFLYSAANKDNSNGEIQYVGFRNTLSFGYNVSRKETWKIEPNLGMVLNNNQLIVQNKNNGAFQNLINNQICGNIGLNIKAVSKNGLFTGVKLGYLLPFSSETEWKNKITGNKTGLNDNVGAFYLQFNLGGLLDLTKKE
jgi:hypothetical protein